MSILRYVAVFLVPCMCHAVSAQTAHSASAALKPATFYVDAAAGNDSSNGTSPATAWKTLAKVDATTFHPGDRILLKSGSVWEGQLWPKGSGTEGRPIVVDMYGGGVKPIIHGKGKVEDVVLLKNQEYWEIQNLEITNTGPRRAVLRGVYLALEDYGDAHHIYIRSLTIHDVNGVDSHKNKEDTGGISYSCRGKQKPSRFVDLRIENNDIYHVDFNGIDGTSDRFARSKWYPSLKVVVRGNHLDDIGGNGILVAVTDGALMEYNVVGHANQRSKGFNVGLWPWSTDNTVVQYNEVYGTKGTRDGEGFDSDVNNRNVIIQYNYSHDNDGGFLAIDNAGGYPPEVNAGNIGTIVRYNVSVNDRTFGIGIVGPVENARIYNNTIIVGKGRRTNVILFARWKGWAKGTEIFNNIFDVQGEGQISYAVHHHMADGVYVTAPGLGLSKGTVFDSNVYFGAVQPPKDPHALTGDPMFIEPGGAGIGRAVLRGYRLQPGSPARGTGKPIKRNGGQDFLGGKVPSCGRTDRGAFQSDDCRR